jgi:hypothetical protein
VTELKTHTFVKSAVLAASLSTATSYADVHSSADLIKAQSSLKYHVTHGISLADSLVQVAQRSGITFKINTDLSKDVVSQSIDADDWNIAVKSLLVNYNFTIIQDRDTIKTVIISGRHNNVIADTVTTATTIASVDQLSVDDLILSFNSSIEQITDITHPISN